MGLAGELHRRAGTLLAPDSDLLLECVQELSFLRDLDGVMAVVRKWARRLTAADGVTFVLREGNQVFYADEDAIGPLWKGRRFPASACISGWAMIHREVVAIEDIYQDPRIPTDAYRPTFVKSLLMVPIRSSDPIGAIGSYWARRHRATEREIALVQTLANAAAIALANAEVMRARDAFLSIAAHELRTPLTSLELQLQSMLRELERHPEHVFFKKKVLAASKASKRLTDLIERMLDVSRITVGKIAITLHPEEVDLAAVAAEVIERLREAQLNQGCALELGAASPVVGSWDRVRLEEIVTNLVSNACKYGRGQRVQVSVERRNGRALLAVADDGIGIAPEDLDRIFKPFERAVSNDNYGGLGLGLYIARRLIEAHGGTIRVASEQGRGSTFTVELPVA
jgi:signal transduction histidine kinase